MASLLLAGPAFAKGKGDDHDDGGDRYGGKNGNKQSEKFEKKAEKRSEKRERQEIQQGAYFNDQQRTFAREYYTSTYINGKRCPLGLAKKNNG